VSPSTPKIARHLGIGRLQVDHLVERFHGSNHMPTKPNERDVAAKCRFSGLGTAFDMISFMESVG
jgi:hypothetical protein